MTEIETDAAAFGPNFKKPMGGYGAVSGNTFEEAQLRNSFIFYQTVSQFYVHCNLTY